MQRSDDDEVTGADAGRAAREREELPQPRTPPAGAGAGTGGDKSQRPDVDQEADLATRPPLEPQPPGTKPDRNTL